MLLLEGSISNFTRARYYFLCVEFSDFYVNQSLTGQTIWKSSTLTNEIDDNLSLLGDGCSIIHHWLIMKNYLPVTGPT
jgi:hypothetical protein